MEKKLLKKNFMLPQLQKNIYIVEYKSIIEFENAFRDWIASKKDVYSVNDLVDIILSRLGVNKDVKCDRPDESPVIEIVRSITSLYSICGSSKD